MNDKIIMFGQKIKEYFLNKSESGSLIIFAIDNEIFKEIGGNELLETDIKNYVQRNGLNWQNNDNIALALAADQVRLIINVNDDQIVSNVLSEHYGIHDLQANYFGNENSNAGETPQEQLWERIVEIFDNRKILIPQARRGAYRFQQFPKSQAFIKSKLESEYSRLFQKVGISKENIVSRQEFNQLILNTQFVSNFCKDICDELRNRANANNISLNHNIQNDLICNLLWNCYQKWDGEYPEDRLLRYSNDDYNDTVIYLELFDDEYGKNFSFGAINTGHDGSDLQIDQFACFESTYYRVFTKLKEQYWKLEEDKYPIPDSKEFVLLVHNPKKLNFPSTNRIDYSPTNDQNINYVAYKYSSKPDGFPIEDNNANNNKIVLNGGIKLKRNSYLFVAELPNINPKLNINQNSFTVQETRINATCFRKIINKTTKKTEISYKIDNFTPNTNKFSSVLPDFYGFDINDLQENIPQTPQNQNYPDDIFDSVFYAKIKKERIQKFTVDTNHVKHCEIKYVGKIKEVHNVGSNTPLFELNPTFLGNTVWECIQQNLININGQTAIINHAGSPLTDIIFKLCRPNTPQISSDYHFSVDILWYKKQGDLVYRQNAPAPLQNLNNLQVCNLSQIPNNPPTSDSNYSELFQYQDAVYFWLLHKGFANWKEIQDVCSTLIETATEQRIYSSNPEYQIFYPLVKIGIFEPCKKNANEYGFCVAEKKAYYNTLGTNKLEYRNYFYGTNIISSREVVSMLPSLAIILRRYTPDVVARQDGYVRFQVDHPTGQYSREWYSTPRYQSNLQQTAPCLFKYEEAPWKDYRFTMPGNIKYQVNSNDFDAISICKSIILAERCNRPNEQKIFSYDQQNKRLQVYNFMELPTYYARALILLNPEILLKDDLYLSGLFSHRSVIFENVEPQTIEALDNLYR